MDVAVDVAVHLAVDVAVAVARSSAPNHVAESSGGVHWKNGCAAPTRIVPATTKG